MNSSMRLRTAVFWGSAGSVAYAYFGFPLLLGVRAVAAPRPVRRAPITPTVSLIIAAHNEAAVIADKLTNVAAIDYPPDSLEVIVASDGSDDATVAIASTHPTKPIVLDLPRRGKNPTLNDAVACATGEVLVFSDADTKVGVDSLRALVAPFADSEVGGVAGDFQYVADGAQGEGERTYWSIDRFTKQLQTRAGSVTSATGQLHAVRRTLWSPVPSGVADDSFTSVGVAEAHHRLVFEPAATATGPVEQDVREEARRKARYIARGLRSVWEHRRALNPLTHGWYAIQLASHKIVRRLVAIPIVLLAIVSPFLWRRGRMYRAATAAQVGVHGLAALGWFAHRRGRRKGAVLRVAAMATYFDLVNVAVLRAMAELARGNRRDVWTPQRSTPGAP
ncbi:MAG: hypothetical protein QOH79_3270 [Acidimicrobiaceae bacterium]